MIEISGKYTNAKIMIDQIDQTTMAQITQMINHPAFTNPIAIMPDTHAGKGSVIGFTMEMTDKIIPNIVGVDIGCGMLTLCVGEDLFDTISKDDLDESIRNAIPFGTNTRDKAYKVIFNWYDLNESLRNLAMEFNKRQKYLDLKNKCESVGITDSTIFQQICENVFEGGTYNLSDDVISRLERI